MATAAWNGSTGSFTDAARWSTGTVPGPGDVALINAGTVAAAGLAFSNITIGLNGNSGSAGTLTLNSDTFDAGSVLSINDANSYGATPAPTLVIQGTTTNAGNITFQGTTTSVQFGAGSSLVNAGAINLIGASPQVQTGAGLAAASIVNNGSINITNPNQAFQSPVINAAISGTGTISLGTRGAVAFRQAIGSGQTVAFTGGVNAGSTFEVDAPSAFAANVTGFLNGDSIIFTSIPFSNITYTTTGVSSGVLNLLSGSTVQASVRLSGIYSQATFGVQANPLGSGGLANVIITTTVTNAATGQTTTGMIGAVGAVYRFFDKNYGTHFFTADVGERNTVVATRPDLVQETNGFGDVQSTDNGATAVYRFFDTKFGTHFFTASLTERDQVAAARPDLTYEASSTFYEHATQQAGDVAVYRFFDSKFGTHFYTGDQNEYNGIVTQGTPTYRADLTFEKVEFYAPAGSFT